MSTMRFTEITVNHATKGEVKMQVKRLSPLDIVKKGVYKSQLLEGANPSTLDFDSQITADLLALIKVAIPNPPTWCDFSEFYEKEDLDFIKAIADQLDKVDFFRSE